MSYIITSGTTRGTVSVYRNEPSPSPSAGQWLYTRDNQWPVLPSPTVNTNDAQAVGIEWTGSPGAYISQIN